MTIVINDVINGGSSNGDVASFRAPVSLANAKLIQTMSTRDITTEQRELLSSTRDSIAGTIAAEVDNAYRQAAYLVWWDNPSILADVPAADVESTFFGPMGNIGFGAVIATGLAPGGPVTPIATNIDAAANPSVSVAHSTSALIVDAGAYEGTATFNFGSGQSTIYNVSATRRRASSYKVVSGAGPTTMSHTTAASAHAYYAAAFLIANAAVFSLQRWNGSAWVDITPSRWNGSVWVPTTSLNKLV